MRDYFLTELLGIQGWYVKGKDTVKGIDKRAIKEAHNSRPLDGITVLGVDEMSIGKGHKYWHMIHALDGL